MWRRARSAGGFLRLVFHRYYRERGPRTAAALSYTTLLALVPLLAVAFALFSRYPVFNRLLELGRDELLTVLAPAVAGEVIGYVESFVAATRRLSALGIVALAVSALLTLKTMDHAVNDIWHVRRGRRLLTSLVAYASVILAGPLLVGVGVSVTTYLASLELLHRWLGEEAARTGLLAWVPAAATLAGLMLIYKFVPNRPVQWRHAVAGAVVGTLLLAAAKRAFGLYLATVPTYHVIYGALATIPVLLVWLFVFWSVILFGAWWASTLALVSRQGGGAMALGYSTAAVLRVLGCFRDAGPAGLDLAALSRLEPELDRGSLRRLVRGLEHAGLLEEVGRRRWAWSAAADRLPLSELMVRLEE